VPEPASALVVGDVDQAYRDAVQQRRRRGGQDLAERGLTGQ